MPFGREAVSCPRRKPKSIAPLRLYGYELPAIHQLGWVAFFLEGETTVAIIFTFGTLVTDWQMYENMRRSFENAGFTDVDCEFITVDNSQGNQCDAYQGLNRTIHRARGAYLILCHQDVLAIDGREVLETCLAALNTQHPRWAVCGNAGGIKLGRLAIRISDPHGEDTCREKLPARVHSLDENFMVLRRVANLGFSIDLKGFHFYGTDICLQAEHLGYEAYVIDFHLRHLGRGQTGASFQDQKQALQRKYHRLYRSRSIQTTCTSLALSASRLYTFLHGVKIWRRGKIWVSRRLASRGQNGA